VWHAEITDPDVFVTLGAIAQCTTRIGLGTAIVPLGTRSIPVVAASAATVSALAPSRFALGVGVSSQLIIEGWNGMTYGRPLVTARESIDLLRSLLGGSRSDYAGDHIRSKGFRLRRPPDEMPPVYLAALNRRMLELAGELADGVLLNFVPVRAVPEVLDAISRGAERAGRDAPPETAMMLACTIDDDPVTARAAFTQDLAFYLSAPPYQRALTWYGLGQHVEKAQAAWRSADIDAVRAGISGDLVDELGGFGPADYCRERLKAYWRAGVTSVGISPIKGDLMRTLEAFVPLAGATADDTATQVSEPSSAGTGA
jgi:probable F420-dependent oxidoreductase